MSIATAYNPNATLNEKLFTSGASKTVYALVTPEIEAIKSEVLGGAEYLEQFRDAWTSKQDAYHEAFFTEWLRWSAPVVEMDRANFPFYYPTAGASEPIRQLIFDHAAQGGTTIHAFVGEYEGYKFFAEAAGLKFVEHVRDGRDGWMTPFGSRFNRVAGHFNLKRDLFFISQPSAIDGNVWHDFGEFISKMPKNSVVVDLTYVGATAMNAIGNRFDMNDEAIKNVVFSLSKPFGAYYDRIGGVWCREENLAMFGNKWFKNLSSLRLGTRLMADYNVYFMANQYRGLQADQADLVSTLLGIEFKASDVFILASAPAVGEDPMTKYLQRAGNLRICLTPGMAEAIGTSGPISK